jgi:hypothetical protein
MKDYASRNISNHELLYVLSSRIIGRDMRQVFAHYGIPLSPIALSSIAAHGMAQLGPEFYAMVPGRGNQLELGRWVDLTGAFPATLSKPSAAYSAPYGTKRQALRLAFSFRQPVGADCCRRRTISASEPKRIACLLRCALCAGLDKFA